MRLQTLAAAFLLLSVACAESAPNNGENLATSQAEVIGKEHNVEMDTFMELAGADAQDVAHRPMDYVDLYVDTLYPAQPALKQFARDGVQRNFYFSGIPRETSAEIDAELAKLGLTNAQREPLNRAYLLIAKGGDVRDLTMELRRLAEEAQESVPEGEANVVQNALAVARYSLEYSASPSPRTGVHTLGLQVSPPDPDLPDARLKVSKTALADMVGAIVGTVAGGGLGAVVGAVAASGVALAAGANQVQPPPSLICKPSPLTGDGCK